MAPQRLKIEIWAFLLSAMKTQMAEKIIQRQNAVTARSILKKE